MCAPHVIEGLEQSAANVTPTPAPVATTTPYRSFSRVVDLTHRLTPDFPLFPGVPKMSVDVIARVEADGWHEAVLTIDEHTGTHVDAPAHFAVGGATIEQIPVERLVAPLAIIR